MYLSYRYEFSQHLCIQHLSISQTPRQGLGVPQPARWTGSLLSWHLQTRTHNCEHTPHITYVHAACSVHLSTHRYPVHIAHVHESPTHPIAGSAAHNTHGHVSCITDTYPGYSYHVCHIHLLCTCHSHVALTCVHGSHTLMYLFCFLPHTDTLGGPVEPPGWVWGVGGQRGRA